MSKVESGGYHTGGSAAAWHYIFPKTQIDVIDIERDCSERWMRAVRLHEPRLAAAIRLVVGSQIDPALLHAVSTDGVAYDLIVDDGSHQVVHQLRSFEILFPLLAPGGVYVVEDMHTSFMAGYRQDATITAAEYFAKMQSELLNARFSMPLNPLVAEIDFILCAREACAVHKKH